MIVKEPSQNPGKVLVTFEFPAAVWAKEVYLVGDFNDWNQQSTPLIQRKDGAWQVQMELLRGREYQFRYLVNQETWHNDWHADKYVPNIHGSDNSVVAT